jgi:glutamine amidotransferase
MIAIVDYGLGNVGSVVNMLKKIGAPAIATSSHDDIRRAHGLILPGVGHFDEGMRLLRQRMLRDVINERVMEAKKPVLGICLGMQLMARGSEEGKEAGLGWIPADVKRFAFPEREKLPVPHMGWNEIDIADDRLFQGLPSTPARFYFVHSYHLVCDDPSHVAAWSTYGYRFAAAVHAGHVYGSQFHPEKSHKFGMSVLKSFVAALEHAA